VCGKTNDEAMKIISYLEGATWYTK
jgi:hypothetical protein